MNYPTLIIFYSLAGIKLVRWIISLCVGEENNRLKTFWTIVEVITVVIEGIVLELTCRG